MASRSSVVFRLRTRWSKPDLRSNGVDLRFSNTIKRLGGVRGLYYGLSKKSNDFKGLQGCGNQVV